MIIPEDANLAITDSKHIHDTSTSIDKSITILTVLIIILLYIWYNTVG